VDVGPDDLHIHLKWGTSELAKGGSAGRTTFDPGCVKTLESQKRGEWISQINQDWPRSEILVALIVSQGEISSIDFLRRRVFTQVRRETGKE
jgi:hypothetical protein